MKLRKRIIAVVCLFSLLITLAPSTIVSAAEKVNYVALGDSIGAGYGLEGYIGGLKAEPPKDSYQSILAADLNANAVNDAVSGMTSEELIQLLNSGNVDEELATADYVSISIGSNDILGLFIKIVSSVIEVKDGEDLMTAAYRQMNESDLLQLAAMIAQITEQIKDNEEIHQAAKAFTTQFAKIIALVKEKAPNASIYATNIYNPYVAVVNQIFPLGTYAEPYIQEMNEAFDLSSEDYTVIDAYRMFQDGSEVNVSFNINQMSTVNLDPHPNKAGHKMLAEAFFKAIQGVTVPGKVKISSVTSKKTNQITVKYKKQEAATGYLITYSTSKNGTYKKLKTTKKASLTITSEKLKSGKTYFIKVTAYTLDGAEKVYGTTSNARKVTMK